MAEEPAVRVSARDAVGGSTEEAGGAGGGVEIVGASGGDDPAVDTLGENDGEPLGKPDGKVGTNPIYIGSTRAMRPKPSSIPSATTEPFLILLEACVVASYSSCMRYQTSCAPVQRAMRVAKSFSRKNLLCSCARNSKSLLLLVSHCSVHPCIEFHEIDTLRSRREASWTVRCGDGPDPVSEGFPRQRILRGSLYTHSRITPTTTSQSPFATRTNSCQPWLTF